MAYARSKDDWKCGKCKRWHRAKTRVCECGNVPQVRMSRKLLNDRVKQGFYTSILRNKGL